MNDSDKNNNNNLVDGAEQQPASAQTPASDWGTFVMGTPAAPSSHPDNRKAAKQAPPPPSQYYQHPSYPHVQQSHAQKPSSSTNPIESMRDKFDYWTKKAEDTANNVWHNLKTGPSVSSAALGKVNLTVKAIAEGGFESLYKQTFETFPNEQLKKTFACYLSTSTGPIAGTLYLSNIHVAFCSDRHLCYKGTDGRQSWHQYKESLSLWKVEAVKPVPMKEDPSERYIQIVTVDGHAFWFMGFINFDKAAKHLSEALSTYLVPGVALPPPTTSS